MVKALAILRVASVAVVPPFLETRASFPHVRQTARAAGRVNAKVGNASVGKDILGGVVHSGLVLKIVVDAPGATVIV